MPDSQHQIDYRFSHKSRNRGATGMYQILPWNIERLTDPSLFLGKDAWPRRLVFRKHYRLVYLSHLRSWWRVVWLTGSVASSGHAATAAWLSRASKYTSLGVW